MRTGTLDQDGGPVADGSNSEAVDALHRVLGVVRGVGIEPTALRIESLGPTIGPRVTAR